MKRKISIFRKISIAIRSELKDMSNVKNSHRERFSTAEWEKPKTRRKKRDVFPLWGTEGCQKQTTDNMVINRSLPRKKVTLRSVISRTEGFLPPPPPSPAHTPSSTHSSHASLLLPAQFGNH